MFADDTLAYITIASKQDCETLQDDLNKLATWETPCKVQFHPGKCYVLTISKKRHPIHYDYNLHGHILQHVESTKYLGCTLNKSLDWKQHIQNISNKANSTLGFLRRNLKISDKRTKELAYKALVRPTLEYASTVWDPHEKVDAQRLEDVQRRAARFVTGRYHNRSSVSNMIDDLGWPSLEQRRKEARLTMLYKLSSGLVYSTTVLQPLQRSSGRTTNSRAYQTLGSRTNARKFSFFPRTIREWNVLPEKTTTSATVDAFKASLRSQV